MLFNKTEKIILLISIQYQYLCKVRICGEVVMVRDGKMAADFLDLTGEGSNRDWRLGKVVRFFHGNEIIKSSVENDVTVALDAIKDGVTF